MPKLLKSWWKKKYQSLSHPNSIAVRTICVVENRDVVISIICEVVVLNCGLFLMMRKYPCISSAATPVIPSIKEIMSEKVVLAGKFINPINAIT